MIFLLGPKSSFCVEEYFSWKTEKLIIMTMFWLHVHFQHLTEFNYLFLSWLKSKNTTDHKQVDKKNALCYIFVFPNTNAQTSWLQWHVFNFLKTASLIVPMNMKLLHQSAHAPPLLTKQKKATV